MKNRYEIAGNVAIICGLVTSAGAAVDLATNRAFAREFAQREALTESLREKYNIAEECVPTGFFDGMPSQSCGDGVPGKSFDEEAKILKAYHQEFNEEQNKIPENTRGNADIAVSLGGLIVAMGGVFAKDIQKMVDD